MTHAGGSPSFGTCYTSDIKERGGAMLQLVENGELGPGQRIELAMAEYLQVDIVQIRISGINTPSQRCNHADGMRNMDILNRQLNEELERILRMPRGYLMGF